MTGLGDQPSLRASLLLPANRVRPGTWRLAREHLVRRHGMYFLRKAPHDHREHGCLGSSATRHGKLSSSSCASMSWALSRPFSSAGLQIGIRRWPSIMISYCVAVLGFIGPLSIPQPRLPGLMYASLFTFPTGAYPPRITVLA